jgi:hypothetical protein
VGQFQYIAKKRAIGFGICAVDNRMGAGDHAFLN